MQQILPCLLNPPILFAHRGARARLPENTISAFQLAIQLGATGLESDVWLTSDGVPVLDHDGVVRVGRLKKLPIAQVRRDQLPAHIPTLSDLLELCDANLHLSLDLKGIDSGPAVVELVRAAAPDQMGRLWLCHPDLSVLAPLRRLDPIVKLVDSTRLHRIEEGSERRAARLVDLRVNAINLRREDWNGGLVTLFHKFGLMAFGWDVQHEHQLLPIFRMGIDGVFSDYVDRMVAAFESQHDAP